MSELDTATQTIDAFFMNQRPEDLRPDSLAELCARTLGSATVYELLDEMLHDPDALNSVAGLSYNVSSSFTKLMLHRAESGWGLRIHLFEPKDGAILTEPWHEHRWMLGSTVLAGEVSSDNAKAIPTETDYDSADSKYLYHVADKKIVGHIQCDFMGQCTLEDRFSQSIPAGSTYGQRTELAHALTLQQPTVTAVVTAPPNRTYASFIEPRPLTYAVRPTPQPLGRESTAASIRSVLSHIDSAIITSKPTESPLPTLLAVIA